MLAFIYYLLRLFFIAMLVVLVVGMWFMVQHEELGNTGSILVGCMSFTAAMMLVVYYISKADLVSNNPQSNGKDKNMIDRSQFKVVIFFILGSIILITFLFYSK